MKRLNIELILKRLVWVFFSIQILLTISGQFTGSRYFTWGPYSSVSDFIISVSMDGRELTRQEIRQRYHLPSPGVEARSIKHVFWIVEQYERTYGRDEKVDVKIKWRTNGKDWQEWRLEK